MRLPLLFCVISTYSLIAVPSTNALKQDELVHPISRPWMESGTPFARRGANERALNKLELAIGLEEASQRKANEAELLHSQAKATVLDAISDQDSQATLPLDLASTYDELGSGGQSELLYDPLLDRDSNRLPSRTFYEYFSGPDLLTSEGTVDEREQGKPKDRQRHALDDRQPLESLRLAYLRTLLQRNRAHKLPKFDTLHRNGIDSEVSRMEKRRVVPQYDRTWFSPSEWHGDSRATEYPMKNGHHRLVLPEDMYLT